MYSGGPLDMDEQRQDDQLEPTYKSSVLIQGVALKTCWKRWTLFENGVWQKLFSSHKIYSDKKKKLRVWTEVCIQIFGGWEVQTMQNLHKND